MKITDVHAVQPPTPGSPQDWRTQLGQIVIEVQTDTGLSGIGVGGGGAASIHVVRTVLRDLLIGREAGEVETLHHDMQRHTSFYGRKGLVIMAISGVDLALWDLRGKTAGKSVAELLDPNVDLGRAISTYATVFDEDDAKAALDAGHAAIKLHVERFGDRPDEKQIAGLVARVREVIGFEGQLMIDAFARWDIDTTRRIDEAIAGFDIAWLEEPLAPDDHAGYKTLSEQCQIPIAGGEHEYTSAGFKELIDHRLHQVLQPDVNWCGGLTTLVEVYRMAQAAGLRVCPHRGCEPFALPAIAALDLQPLAESPRTWFNCLQNAPKIHKGVIRLSSAPGFGVAAML